MSSLSPIPYKIQNKKGGGKWGASPLPPVPTPPLQTGPPRLSWGEVAESEVHRGAFRSGSRAKTRARGCSRRDKAARSPALLSELLGSYPGFEPKLTGEMRGASFHMFTWF